MSQRVCTSQWWWQCTMRHTKSFLWANIVTVMRKKVLIILCILQICIEGSFHRDFFFFSSDCSFFFCNVSWNFRWRIFLTLCILETISWKFPNVPSSFIKVNSKTSKFNPYFYILTLMKPVLLSLHTQFFAGTVNDKNCIQNTLQRLFQCL